MSASQPSVQRVLTGIKPSGTPHLGNYAGAIRPAIAASRQAGAESFYFLADYHALISTTDPLRVQRSTLEIAATWLAAGLDTGRVWFYRQSDIPEIPELTWLLTCVAGKGLLNRAHAYKAAVDKNTAEGADPDAGVNMGLYMYPVLMAADILMFKAHTVPVGRDQIQHIEMARDIAGSFNHLYGEHFVLPEAAIDASVATLPGLDGRKMSKSYDNTIPLFAAPAELKKLIYSIVTDSKAPGEPKDADGSALFDLYQAFADAEDARAMRTAFEEGIAWGEAKQALFEKIEAAVSPMREKYQALVADPAQIEALLHEGAAKARAIATPFLAELRRAVGLRNLADVARPVAVEKAKAALPQFKQYREADGRFHFKLVDAEGGLLLQGEGFASPRDAGGVVAALKRGVAYELKEAALWLNGERVAALAEGVGEVALRAALAAFGD
ncbi:tryptophan--tRNA ligase [Thauera linaloolentis]|uniref:Tryptophan--tRNA ligase n=1 Tax=Thauera linaloolentis (strain DSM 12138 / JCM 21573 / CCUG 41526 / CIP 105981 / IAM 15112 / NBRC 102519 / 47Lol) TaxID=1123367 RepID=N6Z0C7_THAL4|nr:tryptophan--tRNA ligase [Thauera linaloolentis]ENO88077.1 tryptophanyl-tRNA ligase [Thauera linaloolentis 47Lol = DSM 12138]MCM8565214.1 tryptophan--tRNA ligase [Thauera linaloolentis]